MVHKIRLILSQVKTYHQRKKEKEKCPCPVIAESITKNQNLNKCHGRIKSVNLILHVC